jgi:hypothetical protein
MSHLRPAAVPAVAGCGTPGSSGVPGRLVPGSIPMSCFATSHAWGAIHDPIRHAADASVIRPSPAGGSGTPGFLEAKSIARHRPNLPDDSQALCSKALSAQRSVHRFLTADGVSDKWVGKRGESVRADTWFCRSGGDPSSRHAGNGQGAGRRCGRASYQRIGLARGRKKNGKTERDSRGTAPRKPDDARSQEASQAWRVRNGDVG